MRENEYEIIAHYDNDKPIARVWWDGKSIQSDNKGILKRLKDEVILGTTIKDGPKFLDNLPRLFKNGYVSARKVK